MTDMMMIVMEIGKMTEMGMGKKGIGAAEMMTGMADLRTLIAETEIGMAGILMTAVLETATEMVITGAVVMMITNMVQGTGGALIGIQRDHMKMTIAIRLGMLLAQKCALIWLFLSLENMLLCMIRKTSSQSS